MDNVKLLEDLQATPLEQLWPGFSDPPPTKEGLMWYAAHELQKKKGKRGPKKKADGEASPKSKGTRKGRTNWTVPQSQLFWDLIFFHAFQFSSVNARKILRSNASQLGPNVADA